MSNVLTVAGQQTGTDISVLYTTDGINYSPASFNDGGPITLSTAYSSYRVSFIENNGSNWLMGLQGPGSGLMEYAASTNGSNWTMVTAAVNAVSSLGYLLAPSGAAWNGSNWIIVAQNGDLTNSIISSTEGTTWTLIALFSNISYVRGSSIFVGVNAPYSDAFPNPAYTFMQTSADGSAWTAAASANTLLQSLANTVSGFLEIKDLRYNGTTWLADIYTNPATVNYTISATDPTSTWTLLSNIDSAGLGTPSYIGVSSNLWVIGGTGLASSSTGGSTWDVSDMSTVNSGGTISSPSWNGVYWVAAGVDSANVSSFYYSSNATSWTASPINTSNTDNSVSGSFILSSIIASNGGGSNGGDLPVNTVLALYDAVDGVRPGIYYSTDGITFINPDTTVTGNYFEIGYNGSNWLIAGENFYNAAEDTYNATKSVISVDGRNWTFHNLDVTNNLSAINSLEWNGNAWLVLGSSNTQTANLPCLFRSTDGITWSNIDLGFDITAIDSGDETTYSNWFNRVRGAPNLFVGFTPRFFTLSSSNYKLIHTSPDGISWTLQPEMNSIVESLLTLHSGDEARLLDVAYNGSIWLALSVIRVPNNGYKTYTLTSSNAITWLPHSNIQSIYYATRKLTLAASSNMWLIINNDTTQMVPGDSNSIAYSSDGIEWAAATSIDSINQGGNIFKSIWNGTRWIASGVKADSACTLFYSSNAIDWVENTTTYQTDRQFNLGSIGKYMTAFGGGGGGGGGDPGTSNVITVTSQNTLGGINLLYTNNGINFQDTGYEITGTCMFIETNGTSMLMGNNRMGNGAVLSRTTDGSNWTSVLDITGTSEGFLSAAWNGSKWCIISTTGGSEYKAYTSTNGLSWTPLTNSNVFSNMTIIRGKTGLFVGVRGNNFTSNIDIIQTSPDGINWTPMTSADNTFNSIPFPYQVNDVRFNGSTWLATAFSFENSTSYTLTSTNLSTWVLSSNINTTSIAAPLDIGVTSNLWVVAGGVEATNQLVYSSNGTDWTASSSLASLNPGGGIPNVVWNGARWIASGANSSGISQYYSSSNAVTWFEFPINSSNVTDNVIGSMRVGGFSYIGGSGTGPRPPCFLEGTKILCFVDGKEEYLPIQNLKKGILVKTRTSGYKPVTFLGYSTLKNEGLSSRGREQIFVCAPAQYPELTEPLYITGCHSILVDDLTEEHRAAIMKVYNRVFVTEGKYRLESYLDERATPWSAKGDFTIWHLALENENDVCNYGIYANGLLVESICNRRIRDSKTLTLIE